VKRGVVPILCESDNWVVLLGLFAPQKNDKIMITMYFILFKKIN
jgi:hypothetical protein